MRLLENFQQNLNAQFIQTLNHFSSIIGLILSSKFLSDLLTILLVVPRTPAARGQRGWSPLAPCQRERGGSICHRDRRHFNILVVLCLHKYSQNCHFRPAWNYGSLLSFLLSCFMLSRIIHCHKRDEREIACSSEKDSSLEQMMDPL